MFSVSIHSCPCFWYKKLGLFLCAGYRLRRYALLRVPISLRSIRHATLPRFVFVITSRIRAAKSHKVEDDLQHLCDKDPQSL